MALGQLSTASAGSGARFSSYFIVQHGSQWAPAQMIPTAGLGTHQNYLLMGLACVAAESCILTGTLLVIPSLDRVFSLTWRNGHRGDPSFLDGSTLGSKGRLMSLNALSCLKLWREGIGLYKNSSQKTQPFVVTYSDGRWHLMHGLGPYHPTTNVNLLKAISCTAVGPA